MLFPFQAKTQETLLSANNSGMKWRPVI